MSEQENRRVHAGEIGPCDIQKIREAVCIQVEKIYDSCKEKDCIEDAEVLFFNDDVQALINSAINVKFRRADVVHVYADVEPVPFKRGFYTVDVKFFIVVELDLFTPIGIVTVNGLVLFDKKVILFGSEGSVKIFKAHFVEDGIDIPERSTLQQDNRPISKIEVAEPIALTARLVEEKCCEDHHSCCCNRLDNLPKCVSKHLERGVEARQNINLDDANSRNEKNILVSLGLFSIIKLVRLAQLLIPAFDFCVPDKTCIAATEDNPCDLFETIDFPVDEFFPPQKFDFPGAEESEKKFRGL